MFYVIVSFLVGLALFLGFEVYGINDIIEEYFLAFIERLRNRGGKK